MNSAKVPSSKFTPRIRRERTNLSDGSDRKDNVQVFCRLRPLDDEESTCIKYLSSSTLALVTPVEARTPYKEIHCNFKHIFTANANQNEVFEHVAFPLLVDLLRGRSGLLFTYGVTGSGKTFTLSGNRDQPGIMPKCIHALFNTLEEYQSPRFVIKPDRMNGFEVQSIEEAQQHKFVRPGTGSTERFPRGTKKIFKDVTFVDDGIKLLDINESNLYAIFVSYIEIYNNLVFDLLDENVAQAKLLREDYQRNMYVSSAVEVEVKSAEEAFELFNLGQRRKRMGNTRLNAVSSRSHSIFNIRLVQFQQMAHNDNGSPVVPDSNQLQIAQLSFVDLAGSERTNRTQNTGQLLKEASQINNSLMNLRICMDTLRENQQTGANKVVPYRDSRLTLLFKNYFEGDGRVEMIVCVNPAADDYEENIQVMKFAESSQEVKIAMRPETPRYATPFKKTAPKRPAMTPCFTPNPKVKPIAPKVSCLGNFGPEIPEIKLIATNAELTRSALDDLYHVLKVRGQKLETVNQDLYAKEDNLRLSLLDVHQVQLLSDSALKSAKGQYKREKQRADNLENKLADMEVENGALRSKHEELMSTIRDLQKTIEEKDVKLNRNAMDRQRNKQKLELQSERMHNELDAKLRRQREHLHATMMAKDNKFKQIKNIIEQDFDFIPQDEHDITRIEPVVQPAQVVDPQTPQGTTAPRRNLTKTSTPKRHRRSRSAGELWLEHNAIKPIALGTVLQPSMKTRKSVSKLSKAADIINPKQSKYCLITQNQDTNGDMETKVFKADIVPTCGGGAQVIFNDVEKLTQHSPTETNN